MRTEGFRGPFHILVLDDNECEAKLLTGALEEMRSGITVHTVSSPDEATRFLYCEGEFSKTPRPNLVFLDYRMPNNGERVLSLIKGDPDLRTIPVIALSVCAAPETIAEIYDRNANCCINKPLDLTDFTDSLRSALNFWMDTAGRP